MRKYAVLSVLLAVIMTTAGCYTSLTTNLRTAQVVEVKQLKYSRVMDAPNFLKSMKKVGAPAAREFRIKPGNTLRIQVFNEDDISGEYTSDASGVIDFPYVGTIMVAGKTLVSVREELAARLQTLYKEPNISVNIVAREKDEDFTGLKAIVLSDMGSGIVSLRGTERLAEIIASSDTFRDKAAVDFIAIYKPPKGGDQKGTVVLCNLMKLLAEGDHRQNIPIEDGDIVYVPIRENTLLEEWVASMKAVASIISAPIQVENGVRYWLRNPRTTIIGRSRIEK